MTTTTAAPATTAPFSGFLPANTTQVPDQFFDELMTTLTLAETRIVLYVVRRTYGFKKSADNISLAQLLGGIRTKDGRVLDRGTGLSKKSLLQGLRSLQARNILLAERRRSAQRGNEPTTYRLNLLDLGASQMRETLPPGEPLGAVSSPSLGGGSSPSPRGTNSPTQRTVLQHTDLQQSNSSNEKDSKEVERAGASRDRTSPRGFTSVSDLLSREHLPAQRSAATQDTPEHAPEGPARPQEGTKSPEVGYAGPGTSTALPGPPQAPKRSARVADLITAISQEFGDPKVNANISQAWRLYTASGLDEATFFDWLLVVRSNVRGNRNKLKRPMAYFFKILRTRLGLAG